MICIYGRDFGVPLGTPLRFGDAGFLTDPESEWGRYANPDLTPFDAIGNEPCLVLLGEPRDGEVERHLGCLYRNV